MRPACYEVCWLPDHYLTRLHYGSAICWSGTLKVLPTITQTALLIAQLSLTGRPGTHYLYIRAIPK